MSNEDRFLLSRRLFIILKALKGLKDEGLLCVETDAHTLMPLDIYILNGKICIDVEE